VIPTSMMSVAKVRRRYLLPALLIVFAAAALGASSLVRSAPSPAGVTFTTFTPQEAASGSVQLSAAIGISTSAQGRAATSAASDYFGGLPIRESQFAHCVDSGMNPPVNEDCWAVSLDASHFNPPGGTPPNGPVAKPLKYLFVLVEPGTNKILEAQGGR
jgi:hypothetical protein